MPTNRLKTLALTTAITAGCSLSHQTREAGADPGPEIDEATTDQPQELGRVRWERDFDAAMERARKENKPALVLFDEVPGCHTVLSYGKNVLSHPLIVEAIEDHFVPVVVYNNRLVGRDRELLAEFEEPSWNNPVVRIITPDRRPLAPRLADDITLAATADTLISALAAHKVTPPPWLKALADEARARKHGTRRATYAMSCFWQGEADLGALEGVVETNTGFAQGREVVEVHFDPRAIHPEAFDQRAQTIGDPLQANAAFKPSPKDDKHALARTPWRHVPMTPTQAARANAAIARGLDPADLLSPGQLRLAARIRARPDAGWPTHLGKGDLEAAFDAANAVYRATH